MSTIQEIPVTGMSCAACANSVAASLRNQPGVENAEVNYANASLRVTYAPELTSLQTLDQVLRSIGYGLVLAEDADEAVRELEVEKVRQLQKRLYLAAALTIPLVVIGMVFPKMPYANFLMWGLATPVLFLFGRQFFRGAWQQARHGRANMDTLVALSTSIAYFFSVVNTLYPQYLTDKGLEAHVYFEAAAVIITFILLGRLLEERARSQTSGAIRKLMDLSPDRVRKQVADGSFAEVDLESVAAGDLLQVLPGERVPVDGVVTGGRSAVDESALSGEPIPVVKQEGDSVMAGTVNQKGSFVMQAQAVGQTTVLARIIATVKQAQGSRAPVQQLVDKVAGVFVPVVMGIALLSMVVWWIWGGDNAFTYGLLSLVTVLVIACPCALGLATPTAIMVGVGKAADRGILVRDAESLELGRKVDAVILDKTGTLTEGKPRVVGEWWADPERKSDFHSVFLALESRSEHPLAKAVTDHFAGAQSETVVVQDFESVTGSGVQAQVDGHGYRLGSPEWMLQSGAHLPEAAAQQLQDWADKAWAPIALANENGLVAMLAVADQIKSTSADAVAQLHRQGIDVYMLTGDGQATAEAVARQTGIRHVQARMMPGDKGDFVRKLQADGKTVAMVGDGINDSEALALADVGIAMGQGSDIAMETARMTIVASDLLKVPEAFRLSTQTVRTIRQNLFWAFIYNLIGIPLAAGILYPFNGFLLNPMIAGAAMALSSVSVVGNSLRLRWT